LPIQRFYTLQQREVVFRVNQQCGGTNGVWASEIKVAHRVSQDKRANG
jgi:hypothetical protein